ncbi:MAG TPA: PAS domain-containing protein [Prolixibacteraceae bacterium]
MKTEKMNSTDGTSLREKAEEQFIKKRSAKVKTSTALNIPTANIESSDPPKGSESELLKLVHELEVYHIELEMQNEELKLASEKAQTATERYAAIYDFAYTGFFTLDSVGNIFELNHTGATMLGKERSKLVKGNFKQFVTMDTRSKFVDFVLKVFQTTSKQNCDVRLIVKGSPSIFAHLEAIISGDDDKCLLTVLDITRRKQAEAILELKNHEYQLFNELLKVSDQQVVELKREINGLLNKLGEKDKFRLDH